MLNDLLVGHETASGLMYGLHIYLMVHTLELVLFQVRDKISNWQTESGASCHSC